MNTPQQEKAAKTLHLTLKKKWFDMIASGEKKEEYREIKLYWQRRLIVKPNMSMSFNIYDTVMFRNGYAKDAPSITVECKGIEIGKAKPEWSDNWKGEVFIIKLGRLVTP